ncbi:dihydrodipicolinate synthase family protein [Rhizobiales bacterium]|uniref:dihydrodipicolinate synthase family protein n=1 Tax=Hongsoonwoonella zoysiae TaxID=2821844 RepID=UPI00155FD78C|nr:dihydrodipicolinate synthase family protein [Hongsoonwoonella zoysiae]NRG19129.1 dihydrodipicolinate synthase family protein [Hongsoonwoonella zoysiae]
MTDATGLRNSLAGISGILVTPFDSADRIDAKPLRPVIDQAIDAGVHILVSNGNTGEFYSLTLDEALATVAETARMVDGRVPLIGGVGRSVQDACALARASAEAGCSALMVHQLPDPFVSPRGTVNYVRRIADAADGLPLVLYIRNDAIGTQAIAEICAISSVVGVKWATPNPMKLAAAMGACEPNIVWVGGLAEIWAPAFYAVGARGFTSGLINVWPERSVAIHAALERQDYAEARRLIEGMRAFEDVRAEENGGANVSGVKAALAMLGHDCGHARPPAAWPLTDDQSARIADVLECAKKG